MGNTPATNKEEKTGVLLASGFRQDERVEAVLQLGVQMFIQKPYTLERLAKAIYALLY